MALTQPLKGLLSGARRLPRLLAPAFNGPEGMLTAGLATLASDRPGLAAVAEGTLLGRQVGQQAQERAAFSQAIERLPLSAQQRAMLAALPIDMQQKVLAQMMTSEGAEPKVVGRALVDPTSGEIIYRDPAELSGDALFAYRSLGIDPYTATPEQHERAMERVRSLRESGRTNITVDARPPMERALDEVNMKLYDKALEEMQSAQMQLTNLDALDALGRTYGWENLTGRLQSASLPLRQLAASVGLEIGDVPAQEAFLAIGNRMALAARNEGMTGPMSDRDIMFLERMVPRLANTPEGNRLIIEIMRRTAHRRQRRAMEMDRYISTHGTTRGLLEHMARWDRSPENALDLSDLRRRGNALLGESEDK